jgi:hypothetical protein
MSRAGARRIRILESFAEGVDPLEEEMIKAGWGAERHPERRNESRDGEHWLAGLRKKYHRFPVANGASSTVVST